MKRLLIILAACLILLAGCSSKNPSANLPPKNNNGTQAVSVNDNKEQTSSADSSEAKDDQDEIIEAPAGDLVEIKEKLFIAQTSDIYCNAGDYLGKTIKYKGVFDVYEVPETGDKYYSVIRYGPGCCGTDGNVGFEVTWDKEYPSPNDWVEVVGVLEEYGEDGWQFLRLNLSSLTVLPTRGEEYVSQ